jgi:hypothetical protein
MTTLPLIGSSIVFQEVCYFELSTISSALRGQAPFSFRIYIKIPGLESYHSGGNLFCAKVTLYAVITAVTRNRRLVE